MTMTLDQVRQIAESGDYDVIPLSMELYADDCTPIMVLRRLQRVSNHCFLLESVENSSQGRYTFLGFDPSAEITCKNGLVRIGNGAGDHVELASNDPGSSIRSILGEYRSPKLEGLPPFTGGLVGYFSYDYLKYAEPTLVLDAKDEEGFNDVDLMLFDKLVAFDNMRQKIHLIANVRTGQLETSYYKTLMELDQMRHVVKHGEMAWREPGRLTSEFTQLFDKERFCDIVRRAQHHIKEGDIFQVVLSNRLEARYQGSLLDCYRALRTINPSPYMFYFSSEDIELAGASPETLVKLEGRQLCTFPLAGTRPRGTTAEEDARIEAELLADEKELAEHNMLVDLGRNDIGRVAEYGSVTVPKYLSIERFSHVMHIGSTVEGTLREGLDAIDAIGSILPAGTLSGAPKIKAAQIINNLEDNKRGVYGGAIGYLDFAGNMDMCIAIRLVFKKNDKVFVRSGAGIVADSIPENEYQETINKAKATCVALEMAEGGLDQ